MQLIICIANASCRMSSFDFTIILIKRQVLSAPNGEFLRILSSYSFEVSRKTFVRSRLLKKSTSSTDYRFSGLAVLADASDFTIVMGLTSPGFVCLEGFWPMPDEFWNMTSDPLTFSLSFSSSGVETGPSVRTPLLLPINWFFTSVLNDLAVSSCFSSSSTSVRLTLSSF